MRIDAAAFLVIDWRTEQIAPAAAWFASDELRRALMPLLHRRYDRDRPGLTESAIEEGRPLHFAHVEEWARAVPLRERLERDLPPEQAALTWQWYQHASAIACPVTMSDGRSLGVLTLSATPPLPPFDPEAVRQVEVFAELAAVAIDRAQLLEAEARRSRQELALNEAGRAIAGSLDPAIVERRIVEQAALVSGASKACLAQLLSALDQLEIVASIGFTEAVTAERFRLSEGMIGQVARTRVPYRSRPEDRERFLGWVLEIESVSSFIHVPIELGPRLFGVLTVADEAEDAFDDLQLELLLKFARLAAAAMANAADYQHEARVARALASGFIPVEPGLLPGVEIGVRYEPAEGQPTGGDLYGAWAAPDGPVAILIGDASGKGLEVAGLASMVRFFADARSLDSSCPADVLRQVNGLLRTRLATDSFVTGFLAFASGDELTYCNAGHAPPLLLRAGAPPRELRRSGLPLGIEDDPELESRVERFQPGDLLFAFTDGLAEARREGEQFGDGELQRCLDALGDARSPQGLVDAMYERAVEWAGPLADDAALLAVRRQP
jgi:serine phosphatase RsbU (regulator of sigma subunit)